LFSGVQGYLGARRVPLAQRVGRVVLPTILNLERERERERERKRERETKRERERERETKRERKRGRKRERNRKREEERKKDRERERAVALLLPLAAHIPQAVSRCIRSTVGPSDLPRTSLGPHRHVMDKTVRARLWRWLEA